MRQGGQGHRFPRNPPAGPRDQTTKHKSAWTANAKVFRVSQQPRQISSFFAISDIPTSHFDTMEPPTWFWAILLAWLVGRDTIKSSLSTSSREKPELKDRGLGLFTVATLIALAAACLLPTITSTLPSVIPDLLEVGQGLTNGEKQQQQASATTDEGFGQDDFTRIKNATLGFQKVFVINLPDRTDKRDALSLVGTLTGIKLDWVRALRGVDVSDKALPLGVDRHGWRDGGIGSWRSQMNAIRTWEALFTLIGLLSIVAELNA